VVWQHRLTECGEGQVIWEWTRMRIAWINRTELSRVPREWLLTPHFHLWPTRDSRRTRWSVADGIVDLGEHGVLPGVETQNIVTTGLTDFVHRSRWKTCQRKNTMKRIWKSCKRWEPPVHEVCK